MSVFLSLKRLCFTNINANPEQFCPINWLQFTSKENCLNIVGNSVPNCIYQSLFQMNIRVKTHESFNRIAPLTAANRSDCERFLQTSDDLEDLKLILNRKIKFFYTFTNIYIIDIFEKSKKVGRMFNKNEVQFIYESALNLYVIDSTYMYPCNDQVIIKFDKVRNVLTGTELNLDNVNDKELASYYGNELNHPLLDVKSSRNNFSVSFLNCSPFVIYFEDEFQKRSVKFLSISDI